MGLLDKLKHGWNAFFGKGPPYDESKQYIISDYVNYGYSTSYRPDRIYSTKGQEKSLISTVYNRIAVDVAAVDIRHVRLDDNDRFSEEINSGLNNCLKIEANKDQTARQLIQDIVASMFDEGCVAVVPVDTSINPNIPGSIDIETLRVGKIIQWYPNHVRVELYNDIIGQKQEITVLKSRTAIIENPFYAIMNERNSILQRLITKFNLLDVIDAQTGSGKLNMIIQLPYVIKTDTRRDQAEKRRKDIEDQLATSKYGIAYTDGTEKITQLNRPAENNLMNQIQYLTSMLFSQLGLTEEILNGTADEKTMLNYMNRTVVPILRAIVEEFRRKFLTKTARTQGQTIMYFNEPFKLVTINNLAEAADKFTRNEIMSSNEFRQIMGLKPSSDPKADELRNKNLNKPAKEHSVNVNEEDVNIVDNQDALNSPESAAERISKANLSTE